MLSTPITWTHIGSGELQKELEGLALSKLSDKPNVTFHFAGQLTNKEVLNFYTTHPVDLFINVSATEGVPVSIMEAMSFGIPVIATDVGGNSEIVTGENGHLLSADPSANEVKEAIGFFVKLSNEERQRYIKNSRKTWEENYNALFNYQTFVSDLLLL